MSRITIVGAGIVGMAVATILSREHEVTIVARNLPGDDPSIEWASPWAGVSFIAGGCSSELEKKMQLDAFAVYWRWSTEYPESSVKRITIEDFFDDEDAVSKIWWQKALPDIAYYRKDTTIVLNPHIFLPWLRKRLESAGVKFERMTLNALSDAKYLGHEVLINATGLGPRMLADVRDEKVRSVRGQTIVVKSDHDKLFMHDDGMNYIYVIPRLDGTVILGGIRQFDSTDPAVNWEISQGIVKRIHQNLPDTFTPNLSDYQIIGHNVGLRTGRSDGSRIEKEVKNGQKIVHVYGFEAGGYIYSFGAARVARDLVEEFLYPHFPAKS